LDIRVPPSQVRSLQGFKRLFRSDFRVLHYTTLPSCFNRREFKTL